MYLMQCVKDGAMLLKVSLHAGCGLKKRVGGAQLPTECLYNEFNKFYKIYVTKRSNNTCLPVVLPPPQPPLA